VRRTILVLFTVLLLAGAYARTYRMGLIPEDLSKTAPANRVTSVPAVPGAPSFRDMPRIDLSDEVPPVGDQADQGSCVAWSMCYYHRSQLEYRERRWDLSDPHHQFSPAFSYNQVNGGVDLGSEFSSNAWLACEQGSASMADCPYDPYDFTSWPSESAYSHAIPYRAGTWGWMSVRDTIELGYLKQLLCNGSTVVLGITCWENILNIHLFNNTYCVADRYGRELSGHGVAVVGYDDTLPTHDGLGAFRIVNSWGTGWGAAGYFWMSYQAVMDASLSMRYACFLTDMVGYAPQLLARVRVEHPTREQVELKVSVGPSSAPLWNHTFRNWRFAIVDRPFPANNMVFDITEAAPYIASMQTDSVRITCRDFGRDSLAGTVQHFSSQYLPWGNVHSSAETPVRIPRYDTAAAAGARIRRVEMDAGPVRVLSPSGVLGQESTYTPQVEVRNFGLNPVSFPVRLSIGAEYADSSVVSNLAPGDAAVVAFRPWTAPLRGFCPVRCTTGLAGDQFPENDVHVETAQVYFRDLAVLEITSPPDTVDSGRALSPQVRVRNNGTQPESFSARFLIPDEGYEWYPHVWMLPPSRETTATLGPWTPRLAGSHALCCTLRVADMDTTNNTIAGSVFVRGSVGIAEGAEARVAAMPRATFLRGVLLLPASGEGRMASSELLDISGRKVLDLRPGPNDVRALAPGVYFVCQPSAVGREPSAVIKVVVTR